MALTVAICAGEALAVTQFHRQDPAPEITLKDVTGAEVSLAKLKGKIVVVLFGELHHEKSRAAYDSIEAVLQDGRLKDASIVPLMVVTQEVKAADLAGYAGQRLPSTILVDSGRKAFGAYEVAVLPSAVVIDTEGRVVHAVAGLTSRFSDVITDSLLLAAGKLSLQRFEESMNPQPAVSSPEADAELRAGRIALLARQLARRGLEDMAVEKYADALKLNPHHAAAHQELGMLLLKRRRLPEAEAQFRAVLAEQPSSTQALLGLAFVQTQRGGGEAAEAERTVRSVLARSPAEPRAHYLMGMIHELRGRPEDAAASYKKAAQLLLERSEQE